MRSDQLAGLAPEHRRESPVHHPEPAVGPDEAHADQLLVQEGADVLLALPQGLDGPLQPLGHLGGVPRVQQHLADIGRLRGGLPWELLAAALFGGFPSA